MMLFLVVSWILVLVADHARSANILVVLPIPVYSHTEPFMPVLKELGSRGHNLTVISAFPQTPNPEGFNQVTLNLNFSIVQSALAQSGLQGATDFRGFNYEMFGFTKLSPPFSRVLVESIIPHLPPPESSNFDLIITETFFCQEPLAALGYIYNAPVVSKHPGPITPSVAYIMGNPNIDSYTPNIRFEMSEDMNLLERTINFLASKFEVMYYLGFLIPKLEQVMHDAFHDKDLPPLVDLIRNTSLLLTETHFSLNYQRPLLRNIIEIGGMGSKVTPPLPEDLEKILNESDSGVIYFSLGSHFYDPSMDDTIAAVMKTFSLLKQRVFFKWSNTSIRGVPDNVIVRSWFPQTSILAHKNVVLYISHGGLNSIYEACYFGVPVVGTPLFADQPHNINILKHFGMAESVEFGSIQDGSLLKAIIKVLSNPSYKENALKRSRMLKDRPLPMLSEIVYWIEYVMKHGGDSLKPASLRLPWYSLMQLDVFLLLSLILLIILFIPLLIVWKCLRKRTIKTVNKKKNN